MRGTIDRFLARDWQEPVDSNSGFLAAITRAAVFVRWVSALHDRSPVPRARQVIHRHSGAFAFNRIKFDGSWPR